MNGETLNAQRSTLNAQRSGDGGLVPEYERAVSDRRTPLVNGGDVMGVFVDGAKAAESRRFLERMPRRDAR